MKLPHKLNLRQNRCKRTGFCATDLPSVTELYNDADDAMFETIMSNSAHTLQPYQSYTVSASSTEYSI